MKDDYFKGTNGKERLHESSNDNGLRLINLTIIKYIEYKVHGYKRSNVHNHKMGLLRTNSNFCLINISPSIAET